MIRFSNGHELTFACGSGALGFDGRGWWWEQPLRWLGLLDPHAFTVVAKTVTLEPRTGNLSLWHPWTCVRLIRDGQNHIGATNAVGLTNPGLTAWLARDYPVAMRMGYRIAASVKPNDPSEALVMADSLHGLSLAYIEVNVSCPNVGHVPTDVPQILENMTVAGLPLVLKLSHDQVREEFIQATEGHVEAYHAINTISWDQVWANRISPIQKYGHGQKGGVSGDFIHHRAVQCVQNLRTLTARPIIGGGGIMGLAQVVAFEAAGASAFSIGTCFLIHPWKPNWIVKAYGSGKQ